MSQQQMQVFYTQLVLTVRQLYQECHLVHADLSEYNILVHNVCPHGSFKTSYLSCLLMSASFNGLGLSPTHLQLRKTLNAAW